MIHIFFVPGMFGSMIEMALRSFTDLDGTMQPSFRSDGSAHTFRKQHHPVSLVKTFHYQKDVEITTPIYPFADTKLSSIVEEFTRHVPTWINDKKILIYAHDLKWAEINLLFQYHKISLGLGQGLDIFGGNVNKSNITNWNAEYTHCEQMSRWQFREWLSLFYPEWVQEWIVSKNQVSDDFFPLSTQQIIESPTESLLQIIDFCELKLMRPIKDFATEFQQRQMYVIEEYNLICKIFEAVQHNKLFFWNQELSVVGESILQQHFRRINLEWYCNNLDRLPTNSVELQNILYNATEDLHA